MFVTQHFGSSALSALSLSRATLSLIVITLLAGCGSEFQAPSAIPPENASNNPTVQALIADINDYTILDEDEPETEADASELEPPATEESDAAASAEPDEAAQYVAVNAGNSRANLRSGPGLNFDIIGKGPPGSVFRVVGGSPAEESPVEESTTDNSTVENSEELSGTLESDTVVSDTVASDVSDSSTNREWIEICCIADDDGNLTRTAWVAASVVRQAEAEEFTAAEAATSVAVGGEVTPLLPGDVDVRWALDWRCGSERCAIDACQATVTAVNAEKISQQWLPIQHELVWDGGCFEDDNWVFEVNQLNGQERTGGFTDNFLFSYWLGEAPGEPNAAYTFDDGRDVGLWCSGPYNVEINEGDGWLTVYEGETCHDVHSGVLVLLTYTKRWLYTGEFNGQTYDRAYFGDVETLEQRLVETNLEMLWVERK